MINITLPDGSRRPFEQPVSVAEVAASIGAGLAKAALGGKVDGKLVDASFRIDHDASLEIVTEKHPDALDVLRRLIGSAPRHLARGGLFVVEFGFGQADAVHVIARESGWRHVEAAPDLQGIPRVAVMQR